MVLMITTQLLLMIYIYIYESCNTLRTLNYETLWYIPH